MVDSFYQEKKIRYLKDVSLFMDSESLNLIIKAVLFVD